MNSPCTLLYISLTTITLWCVPQELYVIVHGTWAHNELWAQPGGDFFETLRRSSAPITHIIPFTWSGSNNHAERVNAATKLATFIETVPLSTSITLIAHSHGANVVFLASQKLAYRSIDTVYALGAPIDCAHCQPNMKTIGTLYNIFSFGDPVQTVSGYFERVLPALPRSTNVRLMLNGTNPNHAHLHDPLVAHWLTQIPLLVAQTNTQGDTEMPPCVSVEFFDKAVPRCRIDSTLPRLIEDEKRLYAVLAAQMLPRAKIGKIATQRPFGPLWLQPFLQMNRARRSQNGTHQFQQNTWSTQLPR